MIRAACYSRAISLSLLFSLLFSLFFSLCLPTFSLAASPLAPLKLDSPRDTMRSYLEAIRDYKKGVEVQDKKLMSRIEDAERTLDLGGVPYIVREESGQRAAKILKEILDRVIVVDLEKIPDDPNFGRWRLKDTEITINKATEGHRAGEYLFTRETISRLDEFYAKVKNLPYLKGTGGGAFYSEPWNQRLLPRWATGNFLGLQKWQWLGLFLAILMGYILKTITEFVIGIFKKLTARNENSIRHKVIVALEHPVGLVVAAGFWFSAVYFLKFEGIALNILLVAVQLIFSISVVWAAYRLSDVVTGMVASFADSTESELDDQLVPLLSKSLRIFVVVIGILVTIQNLGFNVMSILAGLGLGGLAFALAAKDTAANLFGSVMILLDQPFKVGDWIITKGMEGTVTEIGFRSTRLKTFYDSEVTIPNAELATANIDNMGQRSYRRIKATLGLTYDTPPNKIEDFIEGIKDIIKANEYTRKDYYHVVFTSYGDSSLNILLYCFLQVPDWSTELVQRQNIYLEILKLAERIGVEFAFPTQTLHIESLPGETPSDLPT